MTQADFDVLHAAGGSGGLLGRLNAMAFGAAYPHRVEPFGQCSPALLRLAASSLDIEPGDHLVDLGCGRGGPGLWLARRCLARLTGVDFSPVALAAAAAQAPRAEFRHGLLTDSGLGDGCADAVICIDAALYAVERIRVLTEIGRLLRPGGRALITVARTDPATAAANPRAVVDWRPLVSRAGLTVRRIVELPSVAQRWLRLHGLWLDHAGPLRRVLGTEVAGKLLAEASLPRKLFGPHRELALLLVKP